MYQLHLIIVPETNIRQTRELNVVDANMNNGGVVTRLPEREEIWKKIRQQLAVVTRLLD